MTGDTTDAGAPPTMSRVYCYTVEYGPWTGCIQHARAHAIVVAAPPGGGLPAGPAGPGAQDFPRNGHKFATFGIYRPCQ